MRILAHACLLLSVAMVDGQQSSCAITRVPAEDEAAIRQAYRAISAAFEQHHPERMREHLAVDFVETRHGSATTRTREQFLQEIAQECRHAVAPIHVRLELARFERAGKDVVVGVEEDTTYRVRGRDGKTHAIEYRQRSEDRWVRQSGSWRCVHESDEVPYLARIDNRDVPLQELGKLLR